MALESRRRWIVLALIVVLLLGGVVLTWRLSFVQQPNEAYVPQGSDARSLPDAIRESCENLDFSSPEQGQIAWRDEFEGTTIDRTKWNVLDQDRLSFDQARILAKNATVSGGQLHLTARQERSKDRDYTSAYLNTKGLFTQKFGRWEIRAKLPVAPGRSAGLWPAFWLRPDDAPGEIDVLEAWGTPMAPGRKSYGTALWAVHNDASNRTKTVSGWVKGTGPLDEEFHTFAVDRSRDCMRFSVDGRTTGIVSTTLHPWIESALNGPMNIRLNIQVGSSYWGRAAQGRTVLPASFDVDYVRVYRGLGR